ncbi:MAG: hypothetical protein FWF46_02820 [Oscillospiraceae bacterium]|nr:hypothetical protein [Oscillospiraceae bacterium]
MIERFDDPEKNIDKKRNEVVDDRTIEEKRFDNLKLHHEIFTKRRS